MSDSVSTERAIEEQKRFYDLRANDYLTNSPPDRKVSGRPDHELLAALVDGMQPTGDVLEFGPGPGGFTRELARHGRTVTAVDASPQMLDRNRAEVAADNVDYVLADIFEWQPDRTYDFVFFGFFLSHVPPPLFEDFWGLVARCVGPSGRVGFVDEDHRARDFDDVREVDGLPLARRVLADGRAFDIIKIFWEPTALETQLTGLGWNADLRSVEDTILLGTATPPR